MKMNECGSLFSGIEQFGQLVVNQRHGISVYVIPAGESVMKNGRQNAPVNKGTVMVYGKDPNEPDHRKACCIWLHKGPWQGDFIRIVEARAAKRELDRVTTELAEAERTLENEVQTRKVLLSYGKGTDGHETD